MEKIVVSIDDFCDRWWPMDELLALKKRYPNFKATLFTIPFKTTLEFLYGVAELGWLEIAIHGFHHDDLDEMLMLSRQEIIEGFLKIDFSVYARGFKAPGWRLDEDVIKCCNEFGMWIALHGNHRQWKGLCKRGHYFTTEKEGYGCWFGHARDVEDNYIKKALPVLLKRWRPEQGFAFVSEAIEK